ncbi:MAG: hypothetical protein ABF727_12700 [Gluconobacter oxydans]
MHQDLFADRQIASFYNKFYEIARWRGWHIVIRPERKESLVHLPGNRLRVSGRDSAFSDSETQLGLVRLEIPGAGGHTPACGRRMGEHGPMMLRSDV